MENLESIVKALGVILATLAPLLKFLSAHLPDRHRHLEDSYKRLKAFFDEGATARHPMLVEASFAVAVGHAKLSVLEIELVLRQRRPTQFMNSYMRCRDYLQPDELGDRFELRGIAARPRWRRMLVALGTVVYVLSAGPAFWTMAYVVAPVAQQRGWLFVLGATAVCAMAVAFGVIALIASGKLHHAVRLFEQQEKPAAQTTPASAFEPASLPALPLDMPALDKVDHIELLVDTKVG